MESIKVTIKSQYGNTVIYPACDKAKEFAAIAGTKTLTDATLRHVRNLGYEVYEERPAIAGINRSNKPELVCM